MTFIGYEPGSKAYRFTNGSRNVIISRSANFNEQAGWKRVEDSQVVLPTSEHPSLDSPGQLPRQTDETDNSKQPQGDEEDDLTPQPPKVEIEAQEIEEPVLRRSQRTTKGVPPQRFTISEVTSCNAYQMSHEPQTFQEVLELPKIERENWLQAMQKEMAAMQELQVFSECELPEGQKALGCRWIYKKKRSADGQTQYKARLVAQGFNQLRFAQYDETFAPTVKGEAVRLALAIAATNDWHVYHYDFNTAYLNAELEETVYMTQAPSYESDKPGTVYKLKKAIYGLKQSARNWNKCLDKTLRNIGFISTRADPAPPPHPTITSFFSSQPSALK